MGDCYDCLGRSVWYAFLIWLIVKIIRVVYNHFLGPALGLGVKWAPGSDSWAVVTGSTDGIGLEYGKQLANKGYNVLLISRTQSKLDAVSDTIKQNCPKARKIETLAFDFTSTDYSSVEAKINSLEGSVDVLVNNVGVSYPFPEYFTKLESWKLIEDLINVNIVSVTRMTHIVLSRMEANRRGVIINIASYAGSLPLPLLTVYSATKAYVDYFSRALHLEYESKGIIIQSVLPAFVATAMSRMRPSLFVPNASKYVRSTLSTVGFENRTYGFWVHKLYGSITETVNCLSPSADFMSKMSMNNLQATRKRAYKKLQKQN
ncbi:very-long-chain 3-oxoacyl-CoA reductase [Tetranychus urticae]|uniref:Uncharacterized protein n=1 Tax=Tetranychus urticae TaxID=32264 RepID=T1K4M5_TETUR|nr:very-long-chain 3-oxoacyl-CoA reductase [Tetranychus urticae]